MSLSEYKFTEGELLAIVKALNAGTTSMVQSARRDLLEKIAATGWATSSDIEDLFYLTVPQLDAMRYELSVDRWCDILGLPLRSTFARPTSKQTSAMGSKALSAPDVAQLMIELERFGFSIDPGELVEILLPAIRQVPRVSDSELSILWYARNRHKCSPVRCSVADEGPGGTQNVVRSKLASGYRSEIWYAKNNMPRRLVITPSKHRHRPEPKRETCVVCGYEWFRGDPDSSAAHRAEHKRRLRYLDPLPLPQMLKALGEGDEAEFVTTRSPRWKHREIYRRASAFRREFRYDFVQWHSPDGEPDIGVCGVLLLNAENAIVGACAFREREQDERRWTALQWIWIAPKYRRSGVLTRKWPELRARFGDFRVEWPISEPMRAFLRKFGDDALME